MQHAVTRAELSGLDYVVQTRGKRVSRGWESIAAFNHKGIAMDYADECFEANKTRQEYRVLELSTIQPTYTVVSELTDGE
jgi:hypothetical protein